MDPKRNVGKDGAEKSTAEKSTAEKSTAAQTTAEKSTAAQTTGSNGTNEYRNTRRGVMLHNNILAECNKAAAKKQLVSGERWSMTRLIESILREHFKMKKTETVPKASS